MRSHRDRQAVSSKRDSRFRMKGPSVVETVRLRLSRPEPADAPLIFERYAGDHEVTRYLGWPRHTSLADTHAFLDFSAAEWTRWPAGPYLIWLPDRNRLIGGTGLAFQDQHHAATGYVLASDSWGQGYATEALTAMVELASALGVHELSAFCHPQHRASWHVLEKCTFERDSHWKELAEFPNLAPGVRQPVLRYVKTFERRRK